MSGGADAVSGVFVAVPGAVAPGAFGMAVAGLVALGVASHGVGGFLNRLTWRVRIGAWAANEQTGRERPLLGCRTRIFGRLHEVLAGMATMVRSFAREGAERREFPGSVAEANGVALRGVKRDGKKVEALVALVVTSGRIAVATHGGRPVMRGDEG